MVSVTALQYSDQTGKCRPRNLLGSGCLWERVFKDVFHRSCRRLYANSTIYELSTKSSARIRGTIYGIIYYRIYITATERRKCASLSTSRYYVGSTIHSDFMYAVSTARKAPNYVSLAYFGFGQAVYVYYEGFSWFTGQDFLSFQIYLKGFKFCAKQNFTLDRLLETILSFADRNATKKLFLKLIARPRFARSMINSAIFK